METKGTESPPPANQKKISSPPSHSPADQPSTPAAAASEQFSANFAALYHSIFRPKPSNTPPPPLPFSLSLSPSTTTSPSSAASDHHLSAMTTESRLLHARLILEYQELADHYESSLSRLQSLAEELHSLRAENAELKLANSELLRLVTLSPSRFPAATGRFSPMKTAVDYSLQNSYDNSNSNSHGGVEDERISLPKSISVRSSGYLKVHHGQGNSSGTGSASTTTRNRLPSQLVDQLVPGSPVQHLVYVPGAAAGGGGRAGNKQEPTAVELEVYNQGMRKTELCNKWQETGTCPYGEHCQFAHGITELRPVIRHPRYKTQVCRMVLSGDVCPYGHRCHFRHSLTEQERLLALR